LPIKYAFRDAFGPADLIQDTKETFFGNHYSYRQFDATDTSLAHEESTSRDARLKAGMRFERGKGKYWIPDPNSSSHKPLLESSSRARTMVSPSRAGKSTYGTIDSDFEEPVLNPEEERLYDDARQLEFGDWNYPVITANTVNRESLLYSNPTIVTPATNRNILQPSTVNKKKRKQRIKEIQDSSNKGKSRSPSDSSPAKPLLQTFASNSSTSSGKSQASQRVDLVVEDEEAEEIERVRARKEGDPRWNETETKHFVRVYPADGEEEHVRLGYAPDEIEPNQPHDPEHTHNVDQPLHEDESGWADQAASDEAWHHRDYSSIGEGSSAAARNYDAAHEGNIWGEGGGKDGDHSRK